ncbi:MAG: class I SAM-dependent methyltransferase [Bacteroidota bacterium]
MNTKKDQVEVLSIAEGFIQSSILFALLKLRVFELIDKGSKTLHELAAELGVRPETLSRLLNAGVVLKLLESKDGVNFSIAPRYCSILSLCAGENYLGDWIGTLDYFRVPLLKLDEAILKSEPTIDPSTHLWGDREHTRNFTLAMHNYASLRGKELADFLNTVGCKSLLDLGCGPGTYAFQLGACNPNLELYLLDHPWVLETATEIETRYLLKNNVHYLPLDAMKDDIPGSYDMILVSNTLHGLGEEASRTLIKRLYNSINDGGSLVIQAQYMQDNRLGGRWPVFLDLMQLCVTTHGRNHTKKETAQWMEEAGFRDIQFCRMTLFNTNSFLRGYKRKNGNEATEKTGVVSQRNHNVKERINASF